jgi:hypothetical protein
MKLDLDRFNERVTDWSKDAVSKIKSSAETMGVEHRENSPSSKSSVSAIKEKTKKVDGAIERISISFPRQLVYTQKGAGKGRGGVKGSKWVDKYGVAKSTNPGSFGKMGTGGRKEKPFINNVLDANLNTLADIAADEFGSAIINKMLI